jgi:phosphatidylserine decarboxylase
MVQGNPNEDAFEKFRGRWCKDSALKKQYEEALASGDFQDLVPDLSKPAGATKPNPWKGKDFGHLFAFLKKWYEWTPGGAWSGLDYIVEFSWIGYLNDAGVAFVQHDPGRQMLEEFTKLQGAYMDSQESQAKIAGMVRELGPKRMDDYKVKDWKTFNEFFTREIKEGRRPVDAADDDMVVVAPADCVINMIVDELTPDTRIPVKTAKISVRELLNNSSYAEKFTGGTAVSCILMPDSYHWYHTPVAGTVVEARDDVGGLYYGMKNFPELLNKGNVGYGFDYEMFTDFRRGYLIIKTQYVDAHGGPGGEGYVGMVPVGLNSIGSVNFLPKFKNIQAAEVEAEKGERVGNFQFGGSMNILLFEAGRFPALQLLQGQRIGILDQKERSDALFASSYYSLSRERPPLASGPRRSSS